MSQDVPDIDDSLFFKLLLLVNLTARPFSLLYEKRFRITLTEWRVLLTVASRPGLSAIEVGEALGMEKMNVSRAVRSLEKSGRLMRKPHKTDGRSSALAPTAAGRALFATIGPAALKREDLLLAGLSDKERTLMSKLLDRLIEGARRLPDEQA